VVCEVDDLTGIDLRADPLVVGFRGDRHLVVLQLKTEAKDGAPTIVGLCAAVIHEKLISWQASRLPKWIFLSSPDPLCFVKVERQLWTPSCMKVCVIFSFYARVVQPSNVDSLFVAIAGSADVALPTLPSYPVAPIPSPQPSPTPTPATPSESKEPLATPSGGKEPMEAVAEGDVKLEVHHPEPPFFAQAKKDLEKMEAERAARKASVLPLSRRMIFVPGGRETEAERMSVDVVSIWAPTDPVQRYVRPRRGEALP